MPDRSAIYTDTLAACRDESTDALLAFADAWSFVVADRERVGEVERLMCGERLRAVKAELERRELLSRVNAGVASPADRRYIAWRDLATTLRNQADMLRVFDLCGYHFTHKQGSKEAHAACPVCGGTDRLVITAGPPDLCWCRQCHWGGDVITVARSFRQVGFRDAVTWLSGIYGGMGA